VKQTPVASILPESCQMFIIKQGKRVAARLRCDLLVCGLLLSLIPFLSGCQKAGESLPDIVVEHEITPRPPKVGPAIVTLKLSDSGGSPIKEAQVNLEGNMSHAGMRPVFGEARETEPGRYEAPLELTMGGDWIVIVNITLRDGRKLQRQFEIKAVGSD